MSEMLAVYKSQDLEKLFELTLQDETGLSGHMDMLLHSRNQNWAVQVEEIAHRHSTLFAVGAGHLGGDQGVLNLLRKKGYTTRPIENL